MYRAAILACLGERAATEPRPTFKVTAFASLAPVHVPGAADRAISDKLNCEIANRRAHSVGAFLAYGRDEEYAHLWRCPNVGEDFMRTKQLCIGEGSKVYEGYRGAAADRRGGRSVAAAPRHGREQAGGRWQPAGPTPLSR